jgi:hypothetical protein
MPESESVPINEPASAIPEEPADTTGLGPDPVLSRQNRYVTYGIIALDTLIFLLMVLKGLISWNPLRWMY